MHQKAVDQTIALSLLLSLLSIPQESRSPDDWRQIAEGAIAFLKSENTTYQNLQKILGVLEDEWVTIGAIALQTGFHRNTVALLVGALEKGGFAIESRFVDRQKAVRLALFK